MSEDSRIDPSWRNRTITLRAASDAPTITEGMRLAVVMDGKREIYEVDDVKKNGPFDWDLKVTLIETQLPTDPGATS